jgi:hypothetical protein
MSLLFHKKVKKVQNGGGEALGFGMSCVLCLVSCVLCLVSSRTEKALGVRRWAFVGASTWLIGFSSKQCSVALPERLNARFS